MGWLGAMSHLVQVLSFYGQPGLTVDEVVQTQLPCLGHLLPTSDPVLFLPCLCCTHTPSQL